MAKKDNVKPTSGIKFLWNHMKKYWGSLIIVALLIILTTYFQVISPKLLGNALDTLIGSSETAVVKVDTDKDGIVDKVEEDQGLDKNDIDNPGLAGDADQDKDGLTNAEEAKLLTSPYSDDSDQDGITDKKEVDDDTDPTVPETGYIIAAIQVDAQKEIIASIEAGTGIPEKYKDLLGGTSFGGGESDLTTMSDEDLKTFYDLLQALKPIFALDESAIVNEEGLTADQLQAVQDSEDLTDEQKMMIPFMEPSQLNDFNNAITGFEVDDSIIPAKYDRFINSLWILVISYVALALATFIYNMLMAFVSGHTTKDIRLGLFEKIEQLSIRFFDRTPDGELLSRFINDIDNISNAVNQSITQALSQVAMLGGVIYMMLREDTTTYTLENGFVVNNVLTLSLIAFAIVAIIAALIIVKRAKFYVSRQQGKLGDLNAYIDERIQGQKIVISYNLKEKTVEEFQNYNVDFRDTSYKGQVYSGILMPMMNGIGLINLGFLVFTGGLMAANGELSVGVLVAFINYSQRFFQPLGQIVSQYNMIELGITGASRIQEVYNEKPEVVNKPNAKDIDGIKGEVSLQDLTFGYLPNQPVLKNVNIDVKQGQMVALVGPTGSGKTTVMNLMNRFYDVKEGKILFDGVDIQDITLDTLRRNVGIVLQDSVLFTGTIRDNIKYGKDDATEEEVINAAKLAAIHDFIMTLEDGYDTQVSDKTSVFSTGQKQLISIARTIITDPDLLILDEATSNVDTVTEEKIQVAINNVLHGRTSFVIAHRLKTILDADVIVVLKDGEVIEKGSHEELLAADGFYAELYNNQFVLE